MVPVISIVGRKNTGKTTVVEALVRELTARGYRVGTIKHDAHSFEIDHEGKDSWRHARAGAATVAIASASQVAVIKRVEQEQSPEELVERYFGDVDIVVTEGYKRAAAPKIEVRRDSSQPLCEPGEVFALVAETPAQGGVAGFRPDQTEWLADYIQEAFLNPGGGARGQHKQHRGGERNASDDVAGGGRVDAGRGGLGQTGTGGGDERSAATQAAG